MRATTAPSHGALGYQLVSAEALQAYARHDLTAAIALAHRQAHRQRAEAVSRALRAGLGKLLAWPRRQVSMALRFSH
jgi:hypothetical protein